MVLSQKLIWTKRLADSDIKLSYLTVQRECMHMSYTLVSPVDRFVHKPFSIQAAKMTITSLTRFNGEKTKIYLKKGKYAYILYKAPFSITMLWLMLP
jgi:hypothetical protein